MKAITIRQPWAWAIMHAGKRIENRTREWAYRGEIAIHASKCPPSDEIISAVEWMLANGLIRASDWPGYRNIPHGAIVGVATLVDAVRSHSSKWFCGPVGLVLTDVRPLRRPVPAKGALTLWTVPPEIERQVREQLQEVK